MKRNYEIEDVALLRKEQKEEEFFGTNVLVRYIPHERRKGMIDPRLKASMDAKADANGVIAPPPFDPAMLALPAEKILLYLQKLYDDSAKKKEEEALRLRPDGSADDIVEGDIICERGEIKTQDSAIGFYKYQSKNADKNNRPCYISIHGGGWCMGHPVRNDTACRFLADKANVVVFDIDYSLSPQYPYPAALNDCWNLLKYIYTNAEALGIDKKRICVGGGSAGGNLAAALALKDRDEQTKMIAMQILMVPCLLLRSQEVKGYNVSENDYYFSEEAIKYYGKPEVPEKTIGIGKMVDGYIGEKGVMDSYISPLISENFAGLPKTLIQVSTLDTLWVHGVHYGKFLRNAGCDVKIIMYEGMDHGSVGAVGIYPQAEDFLSEMVEAIENL